MRGNFNASLLEQEVPKMQKKAIVVQVPYNSEYLVIGGRIRHQTTFGENGGFQLHPEQHPLFLRKSKRARSCEIQATKIGGAMQ